VLPANSINMKTAKKANVQKHTTAKKNPAFDVTNKVGNYEKHPFFIKKANRVKEFLDKVGLPESFKAKTS